MHLISIIIPVYNHLPELKKSLESISRQTYRDFEVIIIDDGSEKGIEKEIKKEKYNFSISSFHQENSGAPAARNYGFKLSKGEFVIFWDADILAQPEMLQKMHNVLTIHPEASYVYSDFYYGIKKMPAGKFDAERLKKENYITTATLIRREDVVEWDESLKRFQDWDYWLALLDKNKIGIYIPEYLFATIPHKSGISKWLPKFAYKKPWRYLPIFSKKVKAYEEAKNIILKKHGLV